MVRQDKAFLFKNRFGSYVRGFRRRQTITEPTIKSHRSTVPPKSHQHAPQRKPPDTTILDNFATSKRFAKKHVMITPFCFCLLALGPLGTVSSLGKTPTFGPATATGHPGPAKPVLLLGNDPKSFCKFFQHFYDLQSASFFARFSKILASIKDF